MNKTQIFLVFIAILSIAALYFFGNTKLPKPAKKGVVKSEKSAFNIKNYLSESKDKLRTVQRDSINSLELQLKNAPDKNDSLIIYKELEKIWKNSGSFASASEISYQKALLQHSADIYDEAGKKLIDIFRISEDTLQKTFFVERALSAYEKALQLDPDNEDFKISKAELLIDGKNQVMPGVQALLAVVRNNPENIRANLTLARLAVVSGQFDKALKRLEKVVELEPQNAEAYFQMGGAYEKSGNMSKAIQNYELSMKYLKNKQLKERLRIYLNNIKSK